jgi:hypothetical protein
MKMKKQILWIAIAASAIGGCATQNYSQKSADFFLGESTPAAKVDDGTSLELEKVLADGTAILKYGGDGREITCKLGESAAFGPGKSRIELLASDAQKQTARIRVLTYTQLRMVGP